MRIKLGPSTAYVVCAPELVHQLLAAPAVFDKGGPLFKVARDTLGNGLVTALREDHRRQRALAQPSFSNKRIATYFKVMQEEAHNTIASWSDGQPLDAAQVLSRMTANVTIQALLGSHITDEEVATLPPHLERCTKLTYRRATTPIPALNRLPTRSTRDYWESVAAIRRMGQVSIDRHRKDGASQDSLISSLMHAGTTEEAFTDEELVDQIVTLLFAGAETTGQRWRGLSTTWQTTRARKKPCIRNSMTSWTETPRPSPTSPGWGTSIAASPKHSG
ncbi:cytochrome P450 [Streptomyces albireticuli]|nr:cytochrome P450 [Streptomyces albireticuli]